MSNRRDSHQKTKASYTCSRGIKVQLNFSEVKIKRITLKAKVTETPCSITSALSISNIIQ